MALSYTTALRNAQLDAIPAAIGASGLLRIYTAGGGVPANVGTALTDQVLLATLPLSATSAPAAAAGLLDFNAITDDASADATGTAAFFRILTAGAVAVIQGTVSTSGADLNFNSTAFTLGGTVSVTNFDITAGNA